MVNDNEGGEEETPVDSSDMSTDGDIDEMVSGFSPDSRELFRLELVRQLKGKGKGMSAATTPVVHCSEIIKNVCFLHNFPDSSNFNFHLAPPKAFQSNPNHFIARIFYCGAPCRILTLTISYNDNMFALVYYNL